MIPHVVPATWPEVRPERVAARIRTDTPEGCRVALLGLPDDLGVRLNHGRPGAAEGPAAFRRALARFGAAFDVVRRHPIDVGIYDAGDVVPAPGDDAAALATTHARVREAVRALHAAGLLPICIGGGHDLSFPSIAALSDAVGVPVGAIHVDAHLDVREEPGSGMPFRALVDGGHVEGRRVVALGLGPFSNREDHVRWAAEHGFTMVGVEEVLGGAYAPERALGTALSGGVAALTVDLDGLDGAFAPGVSATNPLGLHPRHVVALARAAGRRPGVRHLDVMELCPAHDEGERTARLAAMVVIAFLAGVAERAP